MLSSSTGGLSRFGGRGWLNVFALAVGLVACIPTVGVQGRVFDPDSLEPLAGVAVRARSAETTTDASGQYRLEVPAGVRELVFAMSDRPAVRKFVIVENLEEHRLDALLPKQKPEGAGLAISRTWNVDDGVNGWGTDVEIGPELSVHDRFGNDDRFPNYQTSEGVWPEALRLSDDGRTLFFAQNFLGPESGTQKGLYRLELESNTVTALHPAQPFWARSLDLSPDGKTLVAVGNEDWLLVDEPFSPTPRARSIENPVAGSFAQVMFAFDGGLFVVRAPSNTFEATRLFWPSLRVDPAWSAGDPVYTQRVLTLPTGELLVDGRGGIRKRTVGGAWSQVLSLEGESSDVIGWDQARGAVYYLLGSATHKNLHWRHLASGLDLLLVSNAEDCSPLRL